MASLTHVCIWSENGWRKITAIEAARMHPGGTVSGKSGLFMCELCGQYVILTDGDKNVRHFRHKISEKSKDCPERTFGSAVRMGYNAREYELPIRVCNITKDQFDLELGLLYVPQSILQRQEMQQVIIQPLESQDAPYRYSFERLSLKTLTYVYIGNIPAAKYKLTVSDELRSFWPEYVKGIDGSGSLFVKRTGKKLPDGADVEVGNDYLLISMKKYQLNSPNIQIQKICERRVLKNTWYIYEVKATAFTEEVASFFLDLHCRLTESRCILNPVWPIYTKTPYVIQHNKDQLLMHIQGENGITERTFPMTTVEKFSCPVENEKVVKIDCKGRQQLISVGRTRVLEYTYFWREMLNKTTPKPVVEILDVDGNVLSSGIRNELPKGKIICVNAQFDGTVIILEDGVVQEKRNLKARSKTEIEDIHLGMEIRVIQGLDVVWSIGYARKTHETIACDADIVKRLKSFNGKMIRMPHEFGAIANKLESYPEVKEWLYRKIKDGHITEGAFRFLKHFIIGI